MVCLYAVAFLFCVIVILLCAIQVFDNKQIIKWNTSLGCRFCCLSCFQSGALSLAICCVLELKHAICWIVGLKYLMRVAPHCFYGFHWFCHGVLFFDAFGWTLHGLHSCFHSAHGVLNCFDGFLDDFHRFFHDVHRFLDGVGWFLHVLSDFKWFFHGFYWCCHGVR